MPMGIMIKNISQKNNEYIKVLIPLLKFDVEFDGLNNFNSDLFLFIGHSVMISDISIIIF